MLYFVKVDEKLFNSIKEVEEQFNIKLCSLRGTVQNTMLIPPEELNELTTSLEAKFIELGELFAPGVLKSFKDLYYDVLKHVLKSTETVSREDIEVMYNYYPIEGETVDTLLEKVFEAKKTITQIEQQIFDAQMRG